MIQKIMILGENLILLNREHEIPVAKAYVNYNTMHITIPKMHIKALWRHTILLKTGVIIYFNGYMRMRKDNVTFTIGGNVEKKITEMITTEIRETIIMEKWNSEKIEFNDHLMFHVGMNYVFR